MAKLTDTQLIVLSKAAQRDDGATVLPEQMTRAAARKVASSLIARKLMREIRAKPGMPVWRMGEDSRCFSLVILKAGRDAIGVEEDTRVHPASVVIANKPSKSKDALHHADRAKSADAPRPEQPIAAAPRSGSKQALVIAMMSAESGATIEALIAATGWLPHTTRAALTGLRKRGFVIEIVREKGQASIYRIRSQPVRLDAIEPIAA